MIDSYDPTALVISLNQAYVASAAELCRWDPRMARILLHMSEEDVEGFAKIRPSRITRVKAIPIALVRPHFCALGVLNARSAADICAPTQAAVERVLGEIQ